MCLLLNQFYLEIYNLGNSVRMWVKSLRVRIFQKQTIRYVNFYDTGVCGMLVNCPEVILWKVIIIRYYSFWETCFRKNICSKHLSRVTKIVFEKMHKRLTLLINFHNFWAVYKTFITSNVRVFYLQSSFRMFFFFNFKNKYNLLRCTIRNGHTHQHLLLLQFLIFKSITS